MNQGNARNVLKRVFVITAASFLMALNINIFVHTGGLYPGGVTGITVLIQRIALMYFEVEIPYTVVNLVLNAFPIYIGFRFIGKRFTLYSLLTIVLTNVLTDVIPYYTITYDTLLIAIFGGIVNGAVLSLCLRVNASTGGTDFLAIYLSEKRGIDAFNYVLGLNAVILGIAGFIFGWDKALYSIIFQFVSTQVVHVLYKRYRQNTLFIVTKFPEEICAKIYEITRHGATIMQGEGSHLKENIPVVYSVISSPDKDKVIRAIHEIDEHAFVNVIKTDEIAGWFYYEPQK